MKHVKEIVVFTFLALLMFNVSTSGVNLGIVKADTQNTTTVQLQNIGDGQSSLSNQITHTSTYSAKLVIPSDASQGSSCIVLYPYNKPLHTLQPFQVHTSYTNALPRFVVVLDTTGDGLANVVLLSDYQFVGNGNWQVTQGGQRWGWSEANPSLSSYGKTWNDFYYWKGVYGDAVVLSVGVALEYWAVKDASGLDQPLYTDEVVLNGVTYNIAAPNQPLPDDWPMYRHDHQRSGHSTSTAPNGNLSWQFNTGDKIRSSPAIVNGLPTWVQTTATVYALNAQMALLFGNTTQAARLSLPPQW